MALLLENLLTKKIAQLEEVTQSSFKQIQGARTWRGYSRGWFRSATASSLFRGIPLPWPWRSLTGNSYIQQAYKEVKNRLDYHISVQDMMCRKEEERMIDWVEKHVVKSISAQQEKETIAKCIEELMLLAKKAQAQPVM